MVKDPFDVWLVKFSLGWHEWTQRWDPKSTSDNYSHTISLYSHNAISFYNRFIVSRPGWIFLQWKLLTAYLIKSVMVYTCHKDGFENVVNTYAMVNCAIYGFICRISMSILFYENHYRHMLSCLQAFNTLFILVVSVLTITTL